MLCMFSLLSAYAIIQNSTAKLPAVETSLTVQQCLLVVLTGNTCGTVALAGLDTNFEPDSVSDWIIQGTVKLWLRLANNAGLGCLLLWWIELPFLSPRGQHSHWNRALTREKYATCLACCWGTLTCANLLFNAFQVCTAGDTCI